MPTGSEFSVTRRERIAAKKSVLIHMALLILLLLPFALDLPRRFPDAPFNIILMLALAMAILAANIAALAGALAWQRKQGWMPYPLCREILGAFKRNSIYIALGRSEDSYSFLSRHDFGEAPLSEPKAEKTRKNTLFLLKCALLSSSAKAHLALLFLLIGCDLALASLFRPDGALANVLYFGGLIIFWCALLKWISLAWGELFPKRKQKK